MKVFDHEDQGESVWYPGAVKVAKSRSGSLEGCCAGKEVLRMYVQ